MEVKTKSEGLWCAPSKNTTFLMSPLRKYQVNWFPKNVTRFPENVTQFTENVTLFPENVTWFHKKGTFFKKQ